MELAIVALASAFVTAVFTYLGTLHRNRTDESLELRSSYQKAHEDLQQFYRDELAVARRERDELKMENQRLWRELREAVEGGEELVALHRTATEGDPL